MQRIKCTACQHRYWIRNLVERVACPRCGGTGDAPVRPCSDCGAVIASTGQKYARKTCGPLCSLAREARKAREKREKRGLKRRAASALPKPKDRYDEPLTKKRKCHDCGAETTDYRCDSCRALWRAKNNASGLSGLSDLFTGGYCYSDAAV